MAVAFDAKGTEAHSSGSPPDPLDFTTLTIGSISNGALLVLIEYRNASSLLGGETVTWDNGGTNQSCTNIGEFIAVSGERIQMWGLVNPTQGNKTLRVTGLSAATNYSIDALSVSGADQGSVATTFTNLATNNGSSTTPSISVTSATGNLAVAQFDSIRTITSTDNTTIFDAGSNAANYAAGAASVSLNATTGSSGSWGSQGINIVAAATSPVPFPQMDFPTASKRFIPRDFTGFIPPPPAVPRGFDDSGRPPVTRNPFIDRTVTTQSPPPAPPSPIHWGFEASRPERFKMPFIEMTSIGFEPPAPAAIWGFTTSDRRDPVKQAFIERGFVAFEVLPFIYLPTSGTSGGIAGGQGEGKAIRGGGGGPEREHADGDAERLRLKARARARADADERARARRARLKEEKEAKAAAEAERQAKIEAGVLELSDLVENLDEARRFRLALDDEEVMLLLLMSSL